MRTRKPCTWPLLASREVWKETTVLLGPWRLRQRLSCCSLVDLVLPCVMLQSYHSVISVHIIPSWAPASGKPSSVPGEESICRIEDEFFQGLHPTGTILDFSLFAKYIALKLFSLYAIPFCSRAPNTRNLVQWKASCVSFAFSSMK